METRAVLTELFPRDVDTRDEHAREVESAFTEPLVREEDLDECLDRIDLAVSQCYSQGVGYVVPTNTVVTTATNTSLSDTVVEPATTTNSVNIDRDMPIIQTIPITKTNTTNAYRSSNMIDFKLNTPSTSKEITATDARMMSTRWLSNLEYNRLSGDERRQLNECRRLGQYKLTDNQTNTGFTGKILQNYLLAGNQKRSKSGIKQKKTSVKKVIVKRSPVLKPIAKTQVVRRRRVITKTYPALPTSVSHFTTMGKSATAPPAADLTGVIAPSAPSTVVKSRTEVVSPDIFSQRSLNDDKISVVSVDAGMSISQLFPPSGVVAKILSPSRPSVMTSPHTTFQHPASIVDRIYTINPHTITKPCTITKPALITSTYAIPFTIPITCSTSQHVPHPSLAQASITPQIIPNIQTNPITDIQTTPTPDIQSIPTPNIQAIPIPNIQTTPNIHHHLNPPLLSTLNPFSSDLLLHFEDKLRARRSILEAVDTGCRNDLEFLSMNLDYLKRAVNMNPYNVERAHICDRIVILEGIKGHISNMSLSAAQTLQSVNTVFSDLFPNR